MTMSPLKQLIDKIESDELWEDDITLERNAYLKVKGSVDTNLYLVRSGSLRIFVVDENEEHTIRFAYEGDFIAALDSFITNGPSELYIQAIKKCELSVLRKQTFMTFIEGSAMNQQLWYTILGLLIFQQMERERDLLTSSPQERFNRVLKRSPRLFQEIPHKYIASYLRMTPETLSRLKKS